MYPAPQRGQLIQGRFTGNGHARHNRYAHAPRRRSPLAPMGNENTNTPPIPAESVNEYPRIDRGSRPSKMSIEDFEDISISQAQLVGSRWDRSSSPDRVHRYVDTYNSMDWMLKDGPADVGGDRRVDLYESMHRMLDSRRIDVGATQNRISRLRYSIHGAQGIHATPSWRLWCWVPFLTFFSSKTFALVLMWHTTRGEW